MNNQSGVIIDTCIWATYFQSRSDPYTRLVSDLVQVNRASLVMPVLAEVVIGIRNSGQAHWISSVLTGLRIVPVTDRDWLDAAHLGRQMMSRGKKLPLVDLVIATVSRRTQFPVLTVDPHFEMIPGLALVRI